jgi:hypothetical protein
MVLLALRRREYALRSAIVQGIQGCGYRFRGAQCRRTALLALAFVEFCLAARGKSGVSEESSYTRQLREEKTMRTRQMLSELSKKWSTLNVIARAEGVAACRKRGVSGHRIAERVGCSESYLRYISPVLDLTDEQKEKIRNGAEVRPFLRVRAEERRVAVRQRCETEVRKTSKVVLRWMKLQDMPEYMRWQVLAETHLVLRSLATDLDAFKLAASLFPAPAMNAECRPESNDAVYCINQWVERLAHYLVHDAYWDDVIRMLQRQYQPR